MYRRWSSNVTGDSQMVYIRILKKHSSGNNAVCLYSNDR